MSRPGPAPQPSRKKWILAAVVLVLVVAGAYAGYRIWFTPLAGAPLTSGEQAPPFTLVDQHGTPVSLQGLLKSGPAIVIFYRGHW